MPGPSPGNGNTRAPGAVGHGASSLLMVWFRLLDRGSIALFKHYLYDRAKSRSIGLWSNSFMGGNVAYRVLR
jgi:hypothetical protein